MGILYVFLSILLLVAQNSERIVGHQKISYLHQDDVDALNAMARGLRMSTREYSRTSCSGRTKGGSLDKIICSCDFNNNTLCHATYIDFSGQHLRGLIPSEVGNLTYLMGLDLSNNKIHGTIPNTFKYLSQLSYISLNQNNLEGKIPNVFGDMKSLEEIDLSSNWFKGTIPLFFTSPPVLQSLDLSNNLLSGGIPREIGKLTSLYDLDLSDNHLSGELPQELGNLANLSYLSLMDNEFSGKLPLSFAALKNLVGLNILGNNFSGMIPEYIDKWENIKYLLLMGNRFEGPLPGALSSLNLSALFVADLLKSDERREFEIPNISRMTSLEYLTLRNCSITGPIPEYLGQMSSLFYLDLSFNNLTGDVPIFNHQNLKYIYLKGNNLNGSVPARLVNSRKTYVDISENNFTNIPIQLGGNSTNVNSFACCANSANLTTAWQKKDYYCHSSKPFYDHLFINCGGDRVLSNGDYYEADSQPYGESTFFLSDDKSWGYSSMGTFLGADHNRYTVQKSCGIDASIYNTARVSPISLKYYGFCMKNGNYKVNLHFAEILYDENKDQSSKGKRFFDIKIQDKKVRENFNIKEDAKGINTSVTLDFNTTVKNHRLEIHLYWNGNGSIRTPMEYYGPLISAISVSPVPRKSGVKLSAVTVAALVGCATLFLALLIFVILWKVGFLGGKQLRGEELKGLELLPGGGSFNFQQIKAATQNFNPLNKIGEGGFGPVYKGTLPNGTTIAVKQLASKSKQGIREFVNELGTIFALQHPNLVKLLGCCTENNQLVLVYEYMENNSLAHALFGPEELRLRLTWPTRFKICHGIAKGLAFLHEESKLKIVHRDIKPTNVLLDKDLNAKISDFGLAKLYEAEHTHVITRIAGTIGYMAPEYAMRGYLTNKADVYSFGVVILEVVSGKSGTSYRPNDESVYLLDLAYVLQEKGELISLVDPILGNDYSLKQAMTILDLAMVCTNPSPTLRPTMSEVVMILEGKSKMKALSFNIPYSTDDFAMAKAEAVLIPRTAFGSNSSGQTSNAITYDIVSREEEENGIFGDCSSEMLDKTEGLTKTVS